MRLFICMVAGGSLCTFLYILSNCLLPYEMGLKQKNIFLKLNMLFYLLPLPWIAVQIKGIIMWVIWETGIKNTPDNMLMELPINKLESIVYKNSNGAILKIEGIEKFMPLILSVFTVFVLLTVIGTIAYLRVVNSCKKHLVYIDAVKYTADTEGTRRKIRIAISKRVKSPVVAGIIKPVIILPHDYAEYHPIYKGVVRHEISHISNWDGAIRLLSYIIIAMGWYNPLVWYLLKENIAVSEMMCDEAAISGMTKTEKTNYMYCIIKAVNKTEDSARLLPALGKSKKLSAKRIERIMDKNQKRVWQKGLGFIVMATCILVCAIPALAYKEPLVITFEEGTEALEAFSQADREIFVPEGMIDEVFYEEPIDFSQGDMLFTSESGETYSIDPEQLNKGNRIQSICSHSYNDGTYQRHVPNGSGGCTVTKYKGKKCTKCSKIIYGSVISTNTYNPCPH